MNTYLGISETLSTEQLDAEAIAASEYLYIEGYLVTSPTGRAAAIKAREIAEAAGVKTALSFSDPGMVEFFRDGIAEIIGDGWTWCSVTRPRPWAGRRATTWMWQWKNEAGSRQFRHHPRRRGRTDL